MQCTKILIKGGKQIVCGGEIKESHSQEHGEIVIDGVCDRCQQKMGMTPVVLDSQISRKQDDFLRRQFH